MDFNPWLEMAVSRGKIFWNYNKNANTIIINWEEFYFCLQFFLSFPGGYVGLFLGYALLQIPEFIVGIWNWFQKFMVRFNPHHQGNVQPF